MPASAQPPTQPPGGTSVLAEPRAALLAILPAAIALIPFGLVLGAAAAQKGLSPAEVALMSGLVFAGSSQFVAVDLWTNPASWLALGFTALLINLRHVLMGASLAGKLGAFPPWSRALAVFFLADEIWAMAERRARTHVLTPAFFFTMGVFMYAGWVLWTVLGTVLGAALGDPKAVGFDFAFTAIFIGLIAGFWTGRRTGLVIAASGVTAAVVHLLVAGPWYVVAGALAGIAVAAIAAPAEGTA
jgi:4-azaleucine resistance transporter AzlC